MELQVFLRAIVGHPALRSSEELRLFLLHPDDLATCARWQELRRRPQPEGARALLAGLELGEDTPAPCPSPCSSAGGGRRSDWSFTSAASSSSGGGGSGAFAVGSAPSVLGRGMVGLSFTSMRAKHSLRGMLARTPEQPQSPQEMELRQAKDMLRHLLEHLTVAGAAAEAVVDRMEGLCEDMRALGEGMAAMAAFGDITGRDDDICGAEGGPDAAERTDSMSRQANKALQAFAQKTSAGLAFLREWQVLVPEAISALEEREAALAVVELLREELADKDAALTRAQQHAAAALRRAGARGGEAEAEAAAGDGFAMAAVQEKLAAQLALEVEDIRERLQAALTLYELLKGRNLSELERLNLERAEGFTAALRKFSGVQAQLAAAVADAWSTPA